jgi:hypothetical protein
MKTTTHKSQAEAVSALKSKFQGLQIVLEEVGQHGEYVWAAKTPFSVRDIQYAGSIYFNHDAQFNKVWHVTGSKI